MMDPTITQQLDEKQKQALDALRAFADGLAALPEGERQTYLGRRRHARVLDETTERIFGQQLRLL